MIHHDAKSRIFMSPTIKSTEEFDISRNPEEPLPPDIGLCLVWHLKFDFIDLFLIFEMNKYF